jgi:glutaredoxin
MTILFGKEGCKLCDAAKEKLDLLAVPYRVVDLQKCSKGEMPEDWRDINLAGAQACYEITETLPWLNLGGKIVSYPEAMKMLRGEKADSKK